MDSSELAEWQAWFNLPEWEPRLRQEMMTDAERSTLMKNTLFKRK